MINGVNMIIKCFKGKRNYYKFPIGIYVCKLPIYPLVNDKVQEYHKGMRTINFRFKNNVYSIFINLNKK